MIKSIFLFSLVQVVRHELGASGDRGVYVIRQQKNAPEKLLVWPALQNVTMI